MTGVAAAQWAASRWVEAGRRQIRYREAGAGPALVLVHGLGVSADYWYRNAAPLAETGLRVLAPDLPGFGRTEAGGKPADSPARQARVLIAWSRALGLGSAVYVGHSLSCQSVLELAACEPALVRGLVLAAPTGAGTRWQRLGQLTRLMVDALQEPLSLVTLVGLAYLRAGPVRVFRTWWRGAGHDPLELLPRVDAPSIVVVGTRDPIVDREFARALANGLPEGRIGWVEGGSHAVQYKRPEEFNRVVVEFVQNLPVLQPETR